MPQIIIVTGTPGVGKTELAIDIARKTGFDFLSLSEIVKKERLHNGFDRSTQSYVVNEGRVRKRLRGYFADRGRKGVVIETHSVGPFLPRSPSMIALVLRLDPVVLYKRLKARGWSKRKTWENVEAEMIDVCLFESLRFLGTGRVYEIDTTGKTRSMVLKEALRILSSGRKWHAGRTNWLEKYDPVSLLRKL